MDEAEILHVPAAGDTHATANPVLANTANVIGALVAAEGWISPARFQASVTAAEAVGAILGDAALGELLVLRAIASPRPPKAALSALKSAVADLPVPDRLKIMSAVTDLIAGEGQFGAHGLVPALAAAFGVPLPDRLKQNSGGIADSVGTFVGRAWTLVHTEDPVIVAAREFAVDFHDNELLNGVAEARQAAEPSILVGKVLVAVAKAHESMNSIEHSIEARNEQEATAREFEKAENRLTSEATKRYASISRRAKMMKRHVREDLLALAEDAVEEYEADFRRLSENKKGWFGKLDTADLNDRLVVKNLERRYRSLARRYQDELDLFDREVAEFCDEFTRVADEALRPLSRHEFREIAPQPTIELRLKAAADRASTRTVLTGVAGAVASGVAVHSGLLTAGAIAGAAVTPAGAIVLGAVALAGIWKAFAMPGDRIKRDVRERAHALESGLREEVMSNVPRFENAVDEVVARFRSAAISKICASRDGAARFREIASSYRTIGRQVLNDAGARIARLQQKGLGI